MIFPLLAMTMKVTHGPSPLYLGAELQVTHTLQHVCVWHANLEGPGLSFSSCLPPLIPDGPFGWCTMERLETPPHTDWQGLVTALAHAYALSPRSRVSWVSL